MYGNQKQRICKWTCIVLSFDCVQSKIDCEYAPIMNQMPAILCTVVMAEANPPDKRMMTIAVEQIKYNYAICIKSKFSLMQMHTCRYIRNCIRSRCTPCHLRSMKTNGKYIWKHKIISYKFELKCNKNDNLFCCMAQPKGIFRCVSSSKLKYFWIFIGNFDNFTLSRSKHTCHFRRTKLPQTFK